MNRRGFIGGLIVLTTATAAAKVAVSTEGQAEMQSPAYALQAYLPSAMLVVVDVSELKADEQVFVDYLRGHKTQARSILNH